MKNFKLKTLILPSIVAATAIAPCLTSCSSKATTISVIGAQVDTSKSHVEVDRDSTIYLIPNNGSKITGIKSITVGDKVLTRTAYTFEYEKVNGLAYKLTIFAKSMISVDVKIEVHTTDIALAYASYSGSTLTTIAALKPYWLEVVARFKDVQGDTALAAGEFLVFDATDGTEVDVTQQFLSADGYRLTIKQKYKIVVKSVIDTTKTTELSIETTNPLYA